ncbi:MAG TPA: organomercurial lyase [Acidimicrobiia bacterium]|nr:organomercurial lyase [Acidimicrobiia bacterium]
MRATIYSLLADGEERVDVSLVARRGGWEETDVLSSFRRLADEHRVALVEDGHRIWMAHPFSGVSTPYRAVTGDRSWFANCAWDALAILSMLGDGDAIGERGLVWRVRQGVVAPNGLVRLVVPARNFWDDIGFT